MCLLCLGFWEALLVSGGSPSPMSVTYVVLYCCVLVSGRSSWSQEDLLHPCLLHMWFCCVLISGGFSWFQEDLLGFMVSGRFSWSQEDLLYICQPRLFFVFIPGMYRIHVI